MSMHEPDNQGMGLLESALRVLGMPRRSQQDSDSSGLTARDFKRMKRSAGAVVRVEIIEYGPQTFAKYEMEVGREADTLAEFLAQLPSSGATVRWINVEGIDDPAVLAVLSEFYALHPLAMEDVVHTHQRPKAEQYGETNGSAGAAPLYVVMRDVEMQPAEKGGQVAMESEQISFFMGPGLLISIQESAGDSWDSVRRRLADQASRLRARNADFLLYVLLDTTVDSLFPLLDGYSDRIEAIEDRIYAGGNADIVWEIGALRRELMLVRRAVGPMRELSRQLTNDHVPGISDETRTYLRDVHDHAVQIVDLLETYRDLATGLSETWLGIQGHRMNQVMKTLTLLTAIFIPITFVTGLYGTNFKILPMADHPHGFLFMVGGCLVIVGCMVLWFMRRRWF